MAPAAAYFSIRSGRIPSEEKKITLLASAEAELGAAAAPAGRMTSERIKSPENKRSRDARAVSLLRPLAMDLSIIGLLD